MIHAKRGRTTETKEDQDAFRRFRGCTPTAALRDLRLDRARARLTHGREGVSAVALGCGFTHLGRFAQAYRQRFGAAPSTRGPRAAG